MDKEVFAITNRLMNIIMETQGCKIAEVSVVPEGNELVSIKSRVIIKFVYYDQDIQPPKEHITTNKRMNL